MPLLLLSLLLWVASSFGTDIPPHGRSRVVNGISTTTDKWPWVVSLRYKEYHFCGGSIIRSARPAAILTAAHCLDWLDARDVSHVSVDIGRDDVTDTPASHVYSSYPLNGFVYHPNITYDPYYENTAIDDVGLVFIAAELETPAITLGQDLNVLQDGEDLIAIGYGVENWENQVLTDTLEETTVQFMNDDDCNLGIDAYFTQYWPVQNYTLFLASLGIEYGNPAHMPYNIMQCQECSLCAIGNDTDTCNGDSGSPLVRGDDASTAVQVGIVSYGFECNRPGIPGQYTDVAYYHSWIQRELNAYTEAANGVFAIVLLVPVTLNLVVLLSILL